MNKLTLSEKLELYKFFGAVGFSASVMFFCMIMLAWHPGSKRPSNETGYFALLGSAISLFVNPTSGSKKESNVAVDSQQTTIMARRDGE